MHNRYAYEGLFVVLYRKCKKETSLSCPFWSKIDKTALKLRCLHFSQFKFHELYTAPSISRQLKESDGVKNKLIKRVVVNIYGCNPTLGVSRKKKIKKGRAHIYITRKMSYLIYNQSGHLSMNWPKLHHVTYRVLSFQAKSLRKFNRTLPKLYWRHLDQNDNHIDIINKGNYTLDKR